MNRDACFLLGKITKPHSFKGEVVLWMDVDDPEPYRNVETLWVEQHGTLVPYMLKSLKSHKDRFVAHLHDVTTEAQAKALAGKDIWLPLSELPPIDEGKFYFHEVQGWTLVDAATEEAVGTVMHVVEHAAYPMLEVDFDGNGQGFVPLPEHVKVDVRRDQRVLAVELPAGLLDVYLKSDEDDWDGDEVED